MTIHSGRNKAVLLYGLLFGYVLSFVFEGPVYYSMDNLRGQTCSNQSLTAMAFHMAGLLIAGILVKNRQASKKTMFAMLLMCVCVTPIFAVRNSLVGSAVILAVAIASGIAVACWGSFYQGCFNDSERFKGMADALILANVLMMIAGLTATYISAIAGFALTIGYLVLALIVLIRTDFGEEAEYDAGIPDLNLRGTIGLFFLFIVVITIDSGLMYGVFNCEYASMTQLTAWYWVVPYIVALLTMRTISSGKSGNVYIYIAIVMMIFGFILNTKLPINAPNYIIIDSLLLGASGILDLFWASIVGSSFKYIKNPVRMLSIGWSANVCGVLIGGIFSRYIIQKGLLKMDVALVAMLVICFSLMILPVMLQRLNLLLVNNLYLRRYREIPEEKQLEVPEKAPHIENLTVAEKRVLQQVLLGKTNKAIAVELSVSENTVKTHVRSILMKYDVTTRAELISLLLRQ